MTENNQQPVWLLIPCPTHWCKAKQGEECRGRLRHEAHARRLARADEIMASAQRFVAEPTSWNLYRLHNLSADVIA